MNKKLKPVPADKQKSLGKLPTDVRNKMGYAKKGSMMKARYGTMAKGDVKEGLKKSSEFKTKLEDFKKSAIKKLRGAQVGPAEEAKMSKMMPSMKDSPSTRESKMKAVKMKLSKLNKGGGADMGKKDYKLGSKMQGDYKGKDIKGKAKEFVSTALKQNKGSISKVLKKLAGSQVSDKEAEEIKKLLPSAAKKGKMMDKKNKDKKPGQIFIELKTPSFLKPKEKSMGGEMKKPMKAALGAIALGAVGAKAAKKLMKKKASAVSPAMNYLGDTAKKSMGGEMKGYGAARTSGMGLQDENLIPGKSMDYIKDLI